MMMMNFTRNPSANISVSKMCMPRVSVPGHYAGIQLAGGGVDSFNPHKLARTSAGLDWRSAQ